MKHFYVKVQHHEDLDPEDIFDDLKSGLQMHVGGGDPDCPYLQKLEQVKLKMRKRRTKP